MIKSIVVILWTVGVAIAGYRYGALETEIRVSRAAANEAARASEVAAVTSAKYDSALRDLKQLRADNDMLAQRLRNYRCPVPPARSGLPTNSPAPAGISADLAARINEITEQCDVAANYAAKCREWALEVSGAKPRSP